MDDKKRKALDAALGQIDRQFGKGSVMRLGDSKISDSIESYVDSEENRDELWQLMMAKGF